MELLKLDCLGQALVLEGSMAGWQQLFLGNTVVSELPATPDNEARRAHEFILQPTVLTPAAAPKVVNVALAAPSHADSTATAPDGVKSFPALHCRLETQLHWQPFKLDYQFHINGELIEQGQRTTAEIERQVPVHVVSADKPFSLIGLGALAFKLLKSAKVIKVVLAGASLAAYSWLFSFQFALALLACLVFHEYGHIRAMKYFGMKTKGIYLIPFFGGAALTDEKINTRWQDVVISMMGPCFGLLMSLACLVAYWVTGNIFFAGLASFNALLNLFNLLPILPLDGGHVLKSVTFSMNSTLGIVLCVLAAVFGVVLSYTLGLTLFGFMLLIGSVEIFVEWRSRHNSHLLPLDRYGQIFSASWYAALVAALIGIIWYFSSGGDEILKLPLSILRS
ncbi:site-2 protease family protein [soil metagenome]